MSPEWTKPPKGVLTNLNPKPNHVQKIIHQLLLGNDT